MTSPWSRLTALTLALLSPGTAVGSVLGGAEEINVGGGGVSLFDSIVNITKTVLTYMTLIAVVMIIIAGIMLIFSLGEDSTRDRVKKMVIYVIVGLLLILVARAFIIFILGFG